VKRASVLLLIGIFVLVAGASVLIGWDFTCSGACKGCRCDSTTDVYEVFSECCGRCWSEQLQVWLVCCFPTNCSPAT